MKKLKLFGLVLISLLFFKVDPALAQHYLGSITSNYSGIMGADLQPASIADSRYKLDVNLFSFSIDAAQNAKYFDPSVLPKRNWPYSLLKNTYWMEDPTIDLYKDYVHDQNAIEGRNKHSGLYANAQFDILNFMVSINPKISIGFSAKLRMVNNLDDVHPKLLKLAEESLNHPPLWNQTIDGALFSQSSMIWAEYGFNYAQVLTDEGEHFFKVGGRLKLNRGLAATYAYAKDLDFNMRHQDTASVMKGELMFGYSDNINNHIDNRSSSASFNAKDFYDVVSRLGLGLDLGIVYEWRPDWKDYKYDMDGETDLWRRDQNKYKLRLGASILDIGGMTFQKADLSRSFAFNTTDFLIKETFDGAQDLRDFTQIVDSLIENDPDWVQKEDTSQTFFMNTPTALSLQFDYNVYKDFYVNATAMINLNPKSWATNVRIPNQISVTPAYDHKWFGAGVPLSYNKYSGFRTGLGLRLGPLTVGTPDIKTIIPIGKKQRGGGIYAMLRVPIPYNKTKDRDNDGVSDKLDECIDDPGPWTTMGCPDTDGDGIPDHLDECPEVAGLPEFDGCPDTDGDGIPDHLDKCPEVAGLPEFDGCPDTDGDGIPDHLDKCPEEPGTIENDGCPEIEEEVKEILKTAFENLEFETASATIKPRSLPSLNELATVLAKRPEWDLQISGHTDNVGNPQSNLELSRRRAESVKEALMGWGIEETRLHTLFFGDTQPVQTNSTPEGRQANRRVEMNIIFR